jgi:hypothetical protein
MLRTLKLAAVVHKDYVERTTEPGGGVMGGRAKVLFLFLIFGAAACSGSAQRAAPKTVDAQTQQHVQALGVRVASTRCTHQATAGNYACTVKTPNDVKISVAVSRDRHNKVVYTTTAGLIDGDATARRLDAQLSQQLHSKVDVKCPAVVPANVEGTFTCTAANHTVLVTVLDDHTGDYTYRVTS